jgi:hypothetical protein
VKFTLKLILLVCLFSAVAVADEGDMTGGNKKPPCPQGQASCLTTDGLPEITDEDTNRTDSDSILILIQQYLVSIFE